MAPRDSHDLPGWLRRVFAAPHPLYDHGLGWLLGAHVARLTHTGRRSGREYRTVLEVIERDRTTGAVTLVSGFGPGADWYRNVVAGGPVWLDLGHGPRRAEHEVLDEDEAVAVMRRYEHRGRFVAPVIRRGLGALLGRRYRGTEADRRALVAELPMVRFRPARG